MSRLYSTKDTGEEIGTLSAGPMKEGVRLMRFTWHMNPLRFWQLAISNPTIYNDANDSDISFEAFMDIVQKCQLQETDIDD